jgi:hypothetical protein
MSLGEFARSSFAALRQASWTSRVLRGVLVASAAFALLPNCANTCFLEVNGTCQLSSCASGEAFNDKTKRCVCEVGRIPLGGGCLTQGEANKFCGKGAGWTPRGCFPLSCPAGWLLDLETEQCVSKAQIDQQAGMGAGKTLGCAPGTVLVINQGAGSCVPVAQTCAKDEVYDGRGCVKTKSCPQGQVLDATSMSCVQVTRPSASPKDDPTPTVDVMAWSRANYGPEGGTGSTGLCGPIARKPLAFGVAPGGAMRVIVQIGLQFDGGMTDQGRVITSGIVEATGQPVQVQGAAQIQLSADTLLGSLRAQHAHSQPAQLTTVVKCLVVNGAAPEPVPSTGGA